MNSNIELKYTRIRDVKSPVRGTAEAAGAAEGRSGGGEAGDAGRAHRPEETGWEFERELLFRAVRQAHRRTPGDSQRVRQTAERAAPAHAGHSGILGGTVGAGVRAVAALGRLTEDDDSDNPEEQKRKQEARQAASNAGAILGLAIGAIEAFSQNNQSLTRTTDEEQSIEEEEGFKEFLAGLDEEYGYEEAQQQTM